MTELFRILCRRGQLLIRNTLSTRTMTSATFTNKLANEKSPYLLQHKHNPIEWYPWGDEAFNKAKALNRPIFLSVGYSTCHWCHVMEHESFENNDVANALNGSFVSIKVDREERPDVDKLYMSFVQAMTGSGGWPMSVFLTPSLEPFFGGTYFPAGDNYGRPGFKSILKLVSEKWTEEPAVFSGQGKAIMEALSKGGSYKRSKIPPLSTVINAAYQYKTSSFDKKYGGFGSEPKFPKAVDLEFLLNYGAWCTEETAKANAKHMLDFTLESMALGGIHDHIGKGFHRYSVDAEWHVPHFEKMLYDQTQLLAVYSDFSRLSGGRFRDVVRDLTDYLMECLHHPEGGFYAAEDADSLPAASDLKKKEGAFCVWTAAELSELLKDCDGVGSLSAFEIFSKYFDVQEDGNVPSFMDPHGELTGRNILRMKRTHDDLAHDMAVSPDDLLTCIEGCKSALRPYRARRPPPHLDSKMVTSWQGLAISGFTKASSALEDRELLSVAERNAAFVKKYSRSEDGHLLRSVYRSEDGSIELGSEPIYAFSDDYAFLIQGLLDLYSRNGDDSLLEWAVELQSYMDASFWDFTGETGYFISEENEGGVKIRIQEDQDGAEPCTNSVAVSNLVRLHEILEEKQYLERATKILEGAAERLAKHPFILTKMISPFKRLEEGGTKVVVVGDPSNSLSKEFASAIDAKYIWNGTVIRLDPANVPAFLTSKTEGYNAMLGEKTPTVFVCRGFTCGLPIRTLDELKDRLATL